MGIDHSNPYIHSTTVLCDIQRSCVSHVKMATPSAPPHAWKEKTWEEAKCTRNSTYLESSWRRRCCTHSIRRTRGYQGRSQDLEKGVAQGVAREARRNFLATPSFCAEVYYGTRELKRCESTVDSCRA